MTRANLAVHLAHRGLRMADNWREWRFMDPAPATDESARWLLDRLPADHAARAAACRVAGVLRLSWLDGDRQVWMDFLTPHRVSWGRASSDGAHGGELLLSMNIREIADLVTWCLQGGS